MQRSNKLRLDPVLKVVILALSVLFSVMARAHGNPAYSHDVGVKTSNPRWMTALKDDTLLSSLSLPGTHDSMAFYGGDIGQAHALAEFFSEPEVRHQLQLIHHPGRLQHENKLGLV